MVLDGAGARYLSDGRVEGEDPLAHLSPTAAQHLARTDGFADVADIDVADIMVGSFYDPELDEGYAFEELISYYGGIGRPQTRPFILYPAELPLPEGGIIGAATVRGVLKEWRALLNGMDGASPSAATAS